jgi:hypothetical protein
VSDKIASLAPFFDIERSYMKVSKNQMISGISRFGKEEIVNKIPDKGIKMAVAVALATLKKKPEILDTLLDSKLGGIIVTKDEDGYDVDFICDVIAEAMEEYGSFEVDIPSVPLIAPKETSLTFSSGDIRKLHDYIVGEV